MNGHILPIDPHGSSHRRGTTRREVPALPGPDRARKRAAWQTAVAQSLDQI